jgi:hypothetical protein
MLVHREGGACGDLWMLVHLAGAAGRRGGDVWGAARGSIG